MADEEKQEATQSEAGAEAAGTEKESTSESQEKTEDWEGKYKSLQVEHQKAMDNAENLQGTLDAVYPFVDFAKMQGGGSEEGDYSQEPKTATKDDLQLVESRIDNKLLTLDFRQKHPELREYEKSLVGPAIARIRAQNPRMALDKVLDKAADESKALLESERERGRQEAAKKKAEAAAASGLGSATTTSDKKEEAEAQGESYDEYVARRKKQSAKARGLI